ncbi:GNAT family N-acetyltransferase [Pseudorhodobacter turbinis]|uniref:GNAT family N-acetyltransferase n=1 Tax=Pseudorhodobacter turbinis TaxID=2500533 RepID=A0A4P8EFY6_9RHOB|nr:GNAT family N-acetyltransferase [Pseudorhodobacter turbinis]QCO55699.1 GNAT family N-acetyltransferase [Pseudorhodobacter turbinis]
MRIFPVTTADIPLLHEALTRLSQDLGDQHLASLSALTAAAPTWRALLAVDHSPIGALLATPLFSTTRGGMGLYISDLWVSEEARGQGVGQRLLAAALQEWDPAFVKLSVYDANLRGQQFYERVGFSAQDETNMILNGVALDRLKGQP